MKCRMSFFIPCFHMNSVSQCSLRSYLRVRIESMWMEDVGRMENTKDGLSLFFDPMLFTWKKTHVITWKKKMVNECHLAE